MKLCDVLENTGASGLPDIQINDICFDSRKAAAGNLFVCIKGLHSDGHLYAKSAYDNGCRVFCAEDTLALPEDAVVIYFENTRRLLAEASANLFRHADREMKIIGVTGTKGKTSTSFMISNILKESGYKTGVIGTIGTVIGDKVYESENSTPESYFIHKYLREMADLGYTHCVIEASSQGFKLDRTYGIDFDIGVFTNLSPDHIGDGEHADYDEYRACKKMLFKASKIGFFNADDPESAYMEKDSCETCVEYSVKGASRYSAGNIEFTAGEGKLISEFDFIHDGTSTRFEIPLPGMASVYNSVCSAAVCSYLGIDDKTILAGLSETVIKGRNEIINTPRGFSVIIDYAHNELSVKSFYDTLEPYRKGRFFTVFGCGGNRSKLRRYTMGDIITRHSDVAVISSDNPRYEKLEDIIEDIKKGITAPRGEVIVIPDRKKAIEYCLDNAREKDIVLIVGKGHQNFEEIEGIKYPFDEKQIVLDYLGLK